MLASISRFSGDQISGTSLAGKQINKRIVRKTRTELKICIECFCEITLADMRRLCLRSVAGGLLSAGPNLTAHSSRTPREPLGLVFSSILFRANANIESSGPIFEGIVLSVLQSRCKLEIPYDLLSNRKQTPGVIL